MFWGDHQKKINQPDVQNVLVSSSGNINEVGYSFSHNIRKTNKQEKGKERKFVCYGNEMRDIYKLTGTAAAPDYILSVK